MNIQERAAKIFKNGSNQAIRLPKEYEFEGVGEVMIRREGKSLVITPVRQSWLSFADIPAVADADFMTSRPDLIDINNETRVKF